MKTVAKKHNLNDGYIACYTVKERQSSFNAPMNASDEADLNFVVSLAYEEMSKRDQDLEFAEANGRNLSIKVKTHLYEAVNKSCKVILGESLYDIIKLDYSRKDGLMYLYLDEVRKIVRSD